MISVVRNAQRCVLTRFIIVGVHGFIYFFTLGYVCLKGVTEHYS